MYQLGARGGARNDVETELYNRKIASLIREKTKMERELRSLFQTKAHGRKAGVTKEAIERAREYPVEQLLEQVVRRSFAVLSMMTNTRRPLSSGTGCIVLFVTRHGGD